MQGVPIHRPSTSGLETWTVGCVLEFEQERNRHNTLWRPVFLTMIENRLGPQSIWWPLPHQDAAHIIQQVFLREKATCQVAHQQWCSILYETFARFAESWCIWFRFWSTIKEWHHGEMPSSVIRCSVAMFY